MRLSAPILTAAMTAAVLTFSVAPAFAWGCVAVSDSGTYGYSYNYDDRGDAEDRALNECVARTDEVCEIMECDEDS